MSTKELQSDKLDIINWITEVQDSSIVEKIKAIMEADNNADELAIKSKEEFTLTNEMEAILDNRLEESKTDYITSVDSIARLKGKYAV